MCFSGNLCLAEEVPSHSVSLAKVQDEREIALRGIPIASQAGSSVVITEMRTGVLLIETILVGL